MTADCILSGETCRSAAMAGRAVFKMVASSICMKMEMAINSGNQREGGAVVFMYGSGKSGRSLSFFLFFWQWRCGRDGAFPWFFIWLARVPFFPFAPSANVLKLRPFAKSSYFYDFSL